ncbi:lasso peptide isopeptide bond-forming cyclase [Salmonella enterica subsp. enterica serovar Oslo]|nr:lasso peptide isopeptide bond-forming cyclase [Salmonella enterica subsp. enterica serovar Oslo]
MITFKLKLNDKIVRLNVCDTLSFFQNESIIVMIKGEASLNNIIATSEEVARAIESEGTTKVIDNLSGVFCILIYHKNAIYMGRSIHSGPCLFYFIEDSTIFVSDKISDIKEWNHDLVFNLNIKSAEHYLSGNRTIIQESMITGIYKINNGEFFHFDYQLKPLLLNDEFSVARNTHSVIDNIIDNISMIQGKRDVALFFSGGLDSALIFHSLKESGKKFSAYHFLSDDSDDSEKEFARMHCLKYGVSFIEVNKKLNFNEELYCELNPDSPDEVPLIFESSDELDISQGLINDERLFLCGHGGDHIFGQNPSALFGIDALRNCGLIFMHRKMVEFATLKGKKYKDLLISNISTLKNVSRLHSPAKEDHISDMRLAATQFFCTGINGRVNIFTPFLHKNIVQHYANMPVYDLFNQQFDRYPVRDEAFRRFSSDIFWKKTKRSSSQLIFRILSGKNSEIKNAIERSGLIDALNINHMELKRILYESTTIRLTEELPYVLKLYKLAKYIQLQNIDI